MHETRCVERQKLLANDGQQGDDFGRAVDLANGILVVGAPAADWVPGDPAEPPSEQNHRAGGAAYLFVRSGTTWTEQQKLRPEPAAAELVCDVRLSGRRLGHARRVGAPYQIDELRAGLRDRLSLVGRLAGRDTAHDVTTPATATRLALYNDTLFAGIPDAPPFLGAAAVYNLAP